MGDPQGKEESQRGRAYPLSRRLRGQCRDEVEEVGSVLGMVRRKDRLSFEAVALKAAEGFLTAAALPRRTGGRGSILVRS